VTEDSSPEIDLAARVEELETERQRLRKRVRRQREEITDLLGLRDELNARIAALSADSTVAVDDLGYVFVVTYGRSGSTLLQGILTGIPGYLIRGENGGALYQLFQLHSGLSALREKHGHTAFVRNAWYGIGAYSDDVAYAALRQFALTTLMRPEDDTQVIGFKEIRWPEEDLSEYIAFLRKVFPGARFIVNTRDLEQVSQSKWWAKDPESPQVLAATEQRLLGLLEELGDAAFRVHYNDYVDAPERLKPLFDWLGAAWDEQAVRDTMAVKHSY
jgi:hypothetical protein